MELLIFVLALLSALAGVGGYAQYRVFALPRWRPERLLAGAFDRPPGRLVICLGDSLLHGSISFPVVDVLQRELASDGFSFLNAGVNADLSYNALERTQSCVACRPEFVVILIGTNDVNATLDPEATRRYMKDKKLPQAPTLEWYRKNLNTIVSSLRAETRAHIALMSPPPLGEDLMGPTNLRMREYVAVVKEVASAQQASYLPLFERTVALLERGGQRSPPPYSTDLRVPTVAALRQHLLGWSFERISDANGFQLLTDGIHLNTRGGMLIVDLIREYLERAPASQRISGETLPIKLS